MVRHENASAIRASVQFGPSASAFRRICARRTFWPVPLSFLTTCASSSRSSSVRRTMYFFCIGGLLETPSFVDGNRRPQS
ncbi:MAG: hypothetical protein BGO49_20110 [Planctomycetales bacterium 71-10]|nr:MAG: hypothetical protein BGO49_20110 [Planctomycetales bacterium 71-10]